MKKKIIGLLVIATVLTGSTMLVSAANVDPDMCEHPVVANMSYEYPYKKTLTHQVGVATKPNGEPILVECTITQTWQKYKRACTVCQKIFSTWEEMTGATHSISH